MSLKKRLQNLEKLKMPPLPQIHMVLPWESMPKLKDNDRVFVIDFTAPDVVSAAYKGMA